MASNAPWKAAARRLAQTLRDLGEAAFTVLPALDEEAPRYLRALARLWLAARRLCYFGGSTAS